MGSYGPCFDFDIDQVAVVTAAVAVKRDAVHPTDELVCAAVIYGCDFFAVALAHELVDVDQFSERNVLRKLEKRLVFWLVAF